jgi:hypothetical protein
MYRKLPLSVACSSQHSASLSSPKTLLLEPSWLELAVPRVIGLSALKILHLMLPCKFSRFIYCFALLVENFKKKLSLFAVVLLLSTAGSSIFAPIHSKAQSQFLL